MLLKGGFLNEIAYKFSLEGEGRSETVKKSFLHPDERRTNSSVFSFH